MIKALILWMLGATFEVRLVSCKTGKDIPGRCLYKGGYWKARKVFNRRRGLKSKPGFIVRLQATRLLQHDECPVNFDEYLDFKKQIPKKIWSDDEVQDLKAAMSAKAPRRSNETHDEWVKRVSDILRKETQPIVEAHDIGANAGLSIPADLDAKGELTIGDSNARQSEFMHEHQDELNVYHGEDHGDHECNSDGPLEHQDEAFGYVPTCTICGVKQLENI